MPRKFDNHGIHLNDLASSCRTNARSLQAAATYYFLRGLDSRDFEFLEWHTNHAIRQLIKSPGSSQLHINEFLTKALEFHNIGHECYSDMSMMYQPVSKDTGHAPKLTNSKSFLLCHLRRHAADTVMSVCVKSHERSCRGMARSGI